MLFGLKQRLIPGASVPVTLNFAKAGQIAVVLPVAERRRDGPGPATESEPPSISY